jgi:hypothetical protein
MYFVRFCNVFFAACDMFLYICSDFSGWIQIFYASRQYAVVITAKDKPGSQTEKTVRFKTADD